MAKRKLSPKQRVAIRKELAKKLAPGERQADLLRNVAKKYGITTITARWYLKSASKPKPGKLFGKALKKLRNWGKKKGSFAHRNGSLSNRARRGLVSVVRQAQALAEESLKRAIEAKRLIPKWQIYVKRESHLRKVEMLLKKKLRTVSSKARILHRRIQQLTPK